MAHRDNATRAVMLNLDTTIADAAIQAITASATEREARIRQFCQRARDLPEPPTVGENRDAIIANKTRAAKGLRSIECAYGDALEPALTPRFSRLDLAADTITDREQEKK
jgi:hypothetical protein